MRILTQNNTNTNSNNQQQVALGNGNSNSNAAANSTSRRAVCAAEVFALADALRKSRSVEFALPHSLSVSEVRLLYYLRGHGEFIRSHEQQQKSSNVAGGGTTATNAAAAQTIVDVVSAIRDLCLNNNNSSSSSSTTCVLTEEEIIQLIDLQVSNEVDLYKVVPDVDVRLGESKIPSLIALLQQLKN